MGARRGVVLQAKPAGWNEQQSGWSAMKPRQPGAGGWGEANEWAAKVHISSVSSSLYS